MSINIKTSTRQVAKEAGLLDKLFLCREYMAMRLESIWSSLLQAVSANKNITDLFSAWNSYTAPANTVLSKSLILRIAPMQSFPKNARRFMPKYDWVKATAAIGFIRSVLSTEFKNSGLLKSVWCLTEHKKFNIKKLIIMETKAN